MIKAGVLFLITLSLPAIASALDCPHGGVPTKSPGGGIVCGTDTDAAAKSWKGAEHEATGAQTQWKHKKAREDDAKRAYDHVLHAGGNQRYESERNAWHNARSAANSAKAIYQKAADKACDFAKAEKKAGSADAPAHATAAAHWMHEAYTQWHGNCA